MQQDNLHTEQFNSQEDIKSNSTNELEQNLETCTHDEEVEPVDIQEDATQNTIQDKLKQLEQENTKLKDDLIRASAEMQNAARRALLNLEQAKYQAIQSFAKDMLLVKDYLEYAVKDVTSKIEKLKNSNEGVNQNDFANVHEGIKATLNVLSQTFTGHGIKEIEATTKQKLDPNSHNAVAVVKVEGYEPNTIVSIKKCGYKLNDKVIRAVDVEVAK